jgi:hypothetical protein
MLWTIIIIVVGVFLLFRLLVGLTGNWRATLNRVITQYVAWKQTEPKFSDKQIFMSVLDGRYQQPNKDVGGLLTQMNQRKNQIKNEIETEIEEGMSVIDKYNLPILIYVCLLIEQNNYLDKRKSVEELLEPITSEVKRQGFSKYC